MKTLSTLLVLLALAATSSCGGNSPSPTPTATAVTPTTAPTEPSASPATPGIDWSHRIAVYTTQKPVPATLGTPLETSVALWDVDAAKPIRTIPFHGRAITAELAGRNVVLATDELVEVVDLRTISRRTLFTPPAGAHIQDIRVSPDASLIAITTAPPGELRVLDVTTGTEKLRVAQSDSRLADTRGEFWELQWRADSTGVLVHFATGSEMWGSLATIYLNKAIRVEPVAGFGNVSPDGTRRAGLSGQINCMLLGSHHLVIQDLDTASVLRDVFDEQTIFTPWEWSPDGTEFLYYTRQARGCDDLPDPAVEPPQLWLLKSGTATKATDITAIHARWYGNRLFTADCDQSNEPVVDRFGNPRIFCKETPAAPVTVRLGGIAIGPALNPVPVGVIEP